MSPSPLGQPLVPVATAPLPTAEEENEEVVAMTEAQSDDSDSSTFSPRWERMEYIRCMRLPCEYLDDWTSEELQGFDALREDKKASRLYRRRRESEGKRLRESEPQPEPPVMFAAPFNGPPPQAPNKAAPLPRPAMYKAPPPDAATLQAMSQAMYKAPPPEVARAYSEAALLLSLNEEDWCPACGSEETCQCDKDEVEIAKEERRVHFSATMAWARAMPPDRERYRERSRERLDRRGGGAGGGRDAC